MEILTCNICQQQFASSYALQKHRKTAHPDKIRKYKPKATEASTPKPVSALDRIFAAKAELSQGLKDLEFERDQLSQRILELDDTIAKYKKLL